MRYFIIMSILAAAGVLLFHLLSIPLPWLLGPLTVTVMAKEFVSQPVQYPPLLRNTAFIIIGFILGSSFQLSLMTDLVEHIPGMLASSLVSISFAWGSAIFLSKKSNIDKTSLTLGSIPGGLSQILILMDDIPGTNHAVVVFMQVFRVLMVVLLIPFLVFWLYQETENIQGGVVNGGSFELQTWLTPAISFGELLVFTGTSLLFVWVAKKFRIPSPYVLGPIAAAAVIANMTASTPELPDMFFMFAQFVLGTYLGTKISLKQIFAMKKLGVYLFVFNLALIGLGMIISYVLVQIYPIDFITAFLATAPGGMAEMGVTAKAVQADLAVVTSFQLFRLFFILFICLMIGRYWGRQHKSQEKS